MKIRIVAILAVLMSPITVGAAADEKIPPPQDWPSARMILSAEEHKQDVARDRKPHENRGARYNSTRDMRACLEFQDSLKVIYCVERFH